MFRNTQKQLYGLHSSVIKKRMMQNINPCEIQIIPFIVGRNFVQLANEENALARWIQCQEDFFKFKSNRQSRSSVCYKINNIYVSKIKRSIYLNKWLVLAKATQPVNQQILQLKNDFIVFNTISGLNTRRVTWNQFTIQELCCLIWLRHLCTD